MTDSSSIFSAVRDVNLWDICVRVIWSSVDVNMNVQWLVSHVAYRVSSSPVTSKGTKDFMPPVSIQRKNGELTTRHQQALAYLMNLFQLNFLLCNILFPRRPTVSLKLSKNVIYSWSRRFLCHAVGFVESCVMQDVFFFELDNLSSTLRAAEAVELFICKRWTSCRTQRGRREDVSIPRRVKLKPLFLETVLNQMLLYLHVPGVSFQSVDSSFNRATGGALKH